MQQGITTDFLFFLFFHLFFFSRVYFSRFRRIFFINQTKNSENSRFTAYFFVFCFFPLHFWHITGKLTDHFSCAPFSIKICVACTLTFVELVSVFLYKIQRYSVGSKFSFGSRLCWNASACGRALNISVSVFLSIISILCQAVSLIAILCEKNEMSNQLWVIRGDTVNIWRSMFVSVLYINHRVWN